MLKEFDGLVKPMDGWISKANDVSELQQRNKESLKEGGGYFTRNKNFLRKKKDAIVLKKLKKCKKFVGAVFYKIG